VKKSLCLILLLIWVGQAAFGQQSSPSGTRIQRRTDSPFDQQRNQQPTQKDDVVKISVTLVQVDAVVTDKNGQQVTDLKPEDFEIREDGRVQDISNFTYVTVNAPGASSSAIAPLNPVKTKGKPNIPPPPALRPEQVRRTMALVVDDLTLSFGSVDATRNALKKFVDEQMQPGDLVAIIRTSAGLGVLQQFTADKRALYAAIEKVKWSPNGIAKVSTFDPIRPSANPKNSLDEGTKNLEAFTESVNQYREDIFAIGTLGAINYVVRGLRDLPGRKSVVLFSDGLRIFGRGLNSSRTLEAVQRLTDLANRAAVVIYTVDARGGIAPGAVAEDNFWGVDLRSEAGMKEVGRLIDARTQKLFDSRQGLEYLANNTGGYFLREANDLNLGIKRVLDDQKGYYLIGYVPDAATFKTEDGKRGYHKIQVKVKRPGLTVRSRTGFYAVEEAQNTAKRTPFQQMASALVSPFGNRQIELKLTSLFGHHQQTGSFISSLLHISPEQITFTEEADGWHKAVLDVAAVTLSDNGQLVDQEYKTYTLKAQGDLYQQILKRGFVYTINLPLKKPGAYQLRVAVRDANSERIGSANQFIETPDIGKGQLALSGITAAGANADEASATIVVAQPGQSEQEGSAAPASFGSPSTRKFRPGSEIVYAFVIYNAQTDSANPQPQLESKIALIRDGKAIFTSAPSAIKVNPQSNLKQILVGSKLRLGTNMEPGEYLLQVMVTDKAAKKNSVVMQWTDFEVMK